MVKRQIVNTAFVKTVAIVVLTLGCSHLPPKGRGLPATTGQVSLDVLKKYVESQVKK